MAAATWSLWTVGHSDRSPEELRRLLVAQGLECVADVRRYPASRRHPHFGKERLAAWLAEEGIGYVHLEGLGGHREPRPDSPHTALEGAFRGYADHMGTEEFRAAFERLRDGSHERPTTVMCAERDWRQCHRGLLADRLVLEGATVLHVVDEGAPVLHARHPALRIHGSRSAYCSDVQLGFADWLDAPRS